VEQRVDGKTPRLRSRHFTEGLAGRFGFLPVKAEATAQGFLVRFSRTRVEGPGWANGGRSGRGKNVLMGTKWVRRDPGPTPLGDLFFAASNFRVDLRTDSAGFLSGQTENGRPLEESGRPAEHVRLVLGVNSIVPSAKKPFSTFADWKPGGDQFGTFRILLRQA